MRRAKFFPVTVLLLLTALAQAQESELRSEFRREGDQFKENCTKFSLKSVVGCGEVFFTGHPLHIAVGSLAPQNGFGAGPAFVAHWTPNNDWRLNLNADGVVSTNGSWRAGVYLKAVQTKIKPGTIEVRPFAIFNAYVQTTSLNKVGFFGLGPDTSRSDESFFGMRETIAGTNVIYPVPSKALNLSFYGEANGRFVDIRDSKGGGAPSIEQLYTEATAPGLTSQPAYAQFGEGIRLKPSLFSGAIKLNYFILYQQFVAAGDSRFSFQRFTLDLTHQIPLYRNQKGTSQARDHNGPDDCSSEVTSKEHNCPSATAPVTRNREGNIGLRMLLTESFTSTGHVVPFYFQPTLGGSDINGKATLASYQDYRFRAPNLLLFQGDIEHSLYGPIGVTFLAETGKVALTRGDIEFKHFVHSYAAGLTLRAGGFPMVSLRFAWGGNEGTHNTLSMNNSLLGGSSRPSLY